MADTGKEISLAGFAFGYGCWLILSFGLDAAQLLTTYLCTYAPGREWGPEDRWYVMDKDDGDDDGSQSGFWENRIDDDKWFADDGEKVDSTGVQVDASTRKTYWGDARSDTPLAKTPQGAVLVLLGGFMLVGNIAGLTGYTKTSKVSFALFLVSVAETMDQYFILNLTCSSLIAGASYCVSAIGLLVSSMILYFKCNLALAEARAKNDNDTASNQMLWKGFYFVIGSGAFCSGVYVRGYARSDLQPSGIRRLGNGSRVLKSAKGGAGELRANR